MKKGKVKTRRIKPELPGGFRDYGPADAIARQRMLEKIRKTFEDFGFDPIETPAVERTEILTGGESESQKIIFGVKGSGEKQWDKSLRFDLTVPLARFIAANPNLPKPFKRYQIGNVWRGESPQAGRYREFMQADIDIAGTKSLEADAEIIATAYQTLKNLETENVSISVNFREDALKILEKYGVPEKRRTATLIAVDKKDKLPSKKWREEIKKASGLGEKEAGKYVSEIASSSSGGNYEAVRDMATKMGVPYEKISYDAALVRGLDYYTGMIFEISLADMPGIGTVFGGGRYDDLISRLGGQKIPAVGASLGVDRLYAALEKLGTIKKKATSVRVLILNLSPDFREEYLSSAGTLRGANINTSIYLGDDRTFASQLSYAAKKEIPYILIYGEEERKKGVLTIKNLVTRDQKEIPRGDLLHFFQYK